MGMNQPCLRGRVGMKRATDLGWAAAYFQARLLIEQLNSSFKKGNSSLILSYLCTQQLFACSVSPLAIQTYPSLSPNPVRLLRLLLPTLSSSIGQSLVQQLTQISAFSNSFHSSLRASILVLYRQQGWVWAYRASQDSREGRVGTCWAGEPGEAGEEGDWDRRRGNLGVCMPSSGVSIVWDKFSELLSLLRLSNSALRLQISSMMALLSSRITWGLSNLMPSIEATRSSYSSYILFLFSMKTLSISLSSLMSPFST